MNVSPEMGMGAIRLTVGRLTTEDEIDQASQWIVERLKILGSHLPNWRIPKGL
jgi:cysteine sulfinate desulfinase/cysteine desulfurase-like protein